MTPKLRCLSYSAAVFLACLPVPVLPAEAILTGHATVLDGDTLRIAWVDVRLKGIAAPEDGEAGGSEAAVAMNRLIAGREVRCELTGEKTRRRGGGWRPVGYCSVNGLDLQAAMVRGGWALSCPRYSPRYVGLEPQTGTVQRVGYGLPDYCVVR